MNLKTQLLYFLSTCYHPSKSRASDCIVLILPFQILPKSLPIFCIFTSSSLIWVSTLLMLSLRVYDALILNYVFFFHIHYFSYVFVLGLYVRHITEYFFLIFPIKVTFSQYHFEVFYNFLKYFFLYKFGFLLLLL